MGTWGVTAFEDDTAMEYYDDFCSGSQEIKDHEKNVLDKLLNTTYTVEDWDLEGFFDPVRMLVFAEIVAKTLSKPVSTFPDEEYHEQADGLPHINFSILNSHITQELREKIKKAIIKIRDTKEIHLNELWRDSESYDEWVEYLNDLYARIGNGTN